MTGASIAEGLLAAPPLGADPPAAALDLTGKSSSPGRPRSSTTPTAGGAGGTETSRPAHVAVFIDPERAVPSLRGFAARISSRSSTARPVLKASSGAPGSVPGRGSLPANPKVTDLVGLGPPLLSGGSVAARMITLNEIGADTASWRLNLNAHPYADPNPVVETLTTPTATSRDTAPPTVSRS